MCDVGRMVFVKCKKMKKLVMMTVVKLELKCMDLETMLELDS